MNIEKGPIVLRDIRLEDIEDYIRWHTTETEWMNWDAPWEWKKRIGKDEIIDQAKKRIGDAGSPRRRLEIGLETGEHIGWVASYFIEHDITRLAVGIDIPEKKYRGRGNGRNALECWMEYLFAAYGHLQLYTQTWSGNEPMMKLAEKLGFHETNRRLGAREINGKFYDAITYKLAREEF